MQELNKGKQHGSKPYDTKANFEAITKENFEAITKANFEAITKDNCEAITKADFEAAIFDAIDAKAIFEAIDHKAIFEAIDHKATFEAIDTKTIFEATQTAFAEELSRSANALNEIIEESNEADITDAAMAIIGSELSVSERKSLSDAFVSDRASFTVLTSPVRTVTR